MTDIVSAEAPPGGFTRNHLPEEIREDIKRLIVAGKTNREVITFIEGKHGRTVNRFAVDKYRRRPDIQEALTRRDSEALQAGFASRGLRVAFRSKTIKALARKVFEDPDARELTINSELSVLDAVTLIRQIDSEMREIGRMVDPPLLRGPQAQQAAALAAAGGSPASITQNNSVTLIGIKASEEAIMEALRQKASESPGLLGLPPHPGGLNSMEILDATYEHFDSDDSDRDNIDL